MSRMTCMTCEGWGEICCPRCKGRQPDPFFHSVCHRCDDEGLIACDCGDGTVEREELPDTSAETAPVLHVELDVIE